MRQLLKFIGNVANGYYFKNIVDNLKPGKVTEVYCAVAYIQNKMDIFDFCYKNKIKLKLWGRYDYTVPVVTAVLKTFIDRSSDLYRCFLVKDLFHPKIYWFKGYGAYIGSANISERAWVNNVEAGLFLTENDLVNSGMDVELTEFFSYLAQHNVSTMLNEDIYNEIVKQDKIVNKEQVNFERKAKDTVTLLTGFRPDIYPEKKVKERRKEAFLQEWNATLAIIRDLMKFVVKDENRPPWVPGDTPGGVQVDQFLHSFYYERTKSTAGPRRYLYEESFKANKKNVEDAITRELRWWKSTETGPLGEEEFIKDRAPRLKELLAKNKVKVLTEEEFQELCSLFHAFWNVTRYFPPSELGITEKDPTIEMKKPLAASEIYNSLAPNGMSVTDILYYILYDGPVEQVVHRIYEASHNSEYHIPRFGRSCFGELVGWALPEHFPPRNDRTNKALRGLGYEVVVWNPGVGEEKND